MLGSGITVGDKLSKKLTQNIAKNLREKMTRKPVAQLNGGVFKRDRCISLSEYKDMKQYAENTSNDNTFIGMAYEMRKMTS